MKYKRVAFQRNMTEDKGVGPWLLALFIFVVCGSGESSSNYHIGIIRNYFLFHKPILFKFEIKTEYFPNNFYISSSSFTSIVCHNRFNKKYCSM